MSTSSKVKSYIDDTLNNINLSGEEKLQIAKTFNSFEVLQFLNHYFLDEAHKSIPIAANIAGIDENCLKRILSISDLGDSNHIRGALIRQQGSYHIEIDITIEVLVQNLYDLLTLFVGTICDNGYFMKTNELSSTEGSTLVVTLLRQFAVGGGIVKVQGLLSQTGKAIGQKQSFHRNISSMARHFVVGHELGHLASELGSQTLVEFKAYFGKAMQMMNIAMPSEIKRSWIEEYAADFFGLKVAVEMTRSDNIHPIFAYCGAQLFLSTVICVAKAKHQENMISTTHPITETRMKFLEFAVRELPKEIASTGQALTTALSDAMEPTCGMCGKSVDYPITAIPIIVDHVSRFISPCWKCDTWICWKCIQYGIVDIRERVSENDIDNLLNTLGRYPHTCRVAKCPKCGKELGVSGFGTTLVLCPD